MAPEFNGKEIIGTNAFIQVEGAKGDILAKVDTGADSSSIWASTSFVDDNNKLHFVLFGPHSSHYTGQEMVTGTYKISKVTSSNGISERRYKVPLSVTVNGRKIRAWFTLTGVRASRSHAVLIGRRTLYGKFLVDVSLKAKH